MKTLRNFWRHLKGNSLRNHTSDNCVEQFFLMWNKKPTRCHLVLYLFLLYTLLNMFRATLCPSSGADDLVVFFPRVVQCCNNGLCYFQICLVFVGPYIRLFSCFVMWVVVVWWVIVVVSAVVCRCDLMCKLIFFLKLISY